MEAAPAPSYLPQEVRDTARHWNFDAYLAATLAPFERQSDLIAIAAFVGELERISQTVTEPTLAQIRVQWWRDELQRIGRGDTSDHPIGVALAQAADRSGWPLGLLAGIADAAFDQLSAPDLGDAQMLNAWVGKRYGAPLALATRFRDHALPANLIEAAGRAYGLSVLAHRLRSDVGMAAALGLDGDPDTLRTSSLEAFDGAIPLVRALPRASRYGLLPLSLVRCYLCATDSALPRLTKVRRFAAAHWFARF